MRPTLNVGSDGMGSWSFDFFLPLLQRTFPGTEIIHDATKAPDLMVRSHFTHMERAAPYSCPYIVWSGESRPVALLPDRAPLFEINTFDCSRPNSIYFPHLFAELKQTRRPANLKAADKKYCASYAFSNRVPQRELMFLNMRKREPTCFGFGRSCHTIDNPFETPASNRKENSSVFKDFAYNIAMENAVIPGYMTEKIGYAFCGGSVPIYWGDTAAVNSFFNPDAFFNVGAFPTIAVAAETAVQLWKDPQKLQPFLDAPITVNQRLADYEAIYTEERAWQRPMIAALREAFPDTS